MHSSSVLVCKTRTELSYNGIWKTSDYIKVVYLKFNSGKTLKLRYLLNYLRGNGVISSWIYKAYYKKTKPEDSQMFGIGEIWKNQ